MSEVVKLPELLAPAGSLEKLKVAVDYGADAVYLAGQEYGLRAAADNFTPEQLREGVEYAHARGVKTYVVLNGFLHDEDLISMPEFLRLLEELKVDAVIVSDLGVIETVKQYSNLQIHLSTQASCLNTYSAKLWKKMGVTRVVLGREVSIAEAKKIKDEAGVEVEMFIHGSMCMAYSGNCTISNYTQGRDSNRGGCAHSCRFEYKLDGGDHQVTSHFMSSKDLNGLSVLEQFINAGIDSIKVEGRMKSHLYAGTVSKVYAEALDYYKENKNLPPEAISRWQSELEKFSHRSYAPANLVEPAGKATIFNEREHDQNSPFAMIGRVVAVDSKGLIIQVRKAFNKGDALEVLPFKGAPETIQTDFMIDLKGNALERTKPSTLVRIPGVYSLPCNSLVRNRL